MVTSNLVIWIAHTRHLCQLGRLSSPHAANNLYFGYLFGGLTLGTQIKSMDNSRNRNLLYNVALDTANIIQGQTFNYAL